MNVHAVNDPKKFFEELGGLHDSRIEEVAFSSDDLRLQLKISDLNSNFRGLPEYNGERPCLLIFRGVQDFFIDATPVEGVIIGNASIRKEIQFLVAEIYLNVGPGELSYKKSIGNIRVSFDSLVICDTPSA